MSTTEPTEVERHVALHDAILRQQVLYRAIDSAFQAQIEGLFKNMCSEMAIQPTTGEPSALERFGRGFGIAHRARVLARSIVPQLPD